MKQCFKCLIEKPLNEFYKHSQMGNGHLNKCKDCTKADVKDREEFMKENDPSWAVKEQLRGRVKYQV